MFWDIAFWIAGVIILVGSGAIIVLCIAIHDQKKQEKLLDEQLKELIDPEKLENQTARRRSMNQSKIESLIEVFFNYLSGFVLAYFIYAVVVIPSPRISSSAFAVTSIFTLVSIARTYLWRRFFNAGLHKLVHKFVKNMN